MSLGLRFGCQTAGASRSVVLTAADQPGSITHYTPDGCRQVIVFQCCGGYSTVARSISGTDEEAGADRVVHTLGLDLLAKLLPGQQHEMTIRLQDGRSYLARWTHDG